MLHTVTGRLAVLLVSACLSTLVGATSQRTFVSRDGVDNPSCSLTAPCRQFAAAVAATSSAGEVIVLDSAGYGKVMITQSISIIAPAGVYAGISVLLGFDGVTINAGATDKVVLRGLTINGQGGNNGILFAQGAQLNVEDCEISNMAVDGIAASAANGKVIVKNTVSRDNAGNGFSIAGGNLQATLDSVHLTNNGASGLYATGYATAIINDSLIDGNAIGLQGNGPAIGITTIVASHNKITRNSTGVLTSVLMGLVLAWLDGNLFSFNATAVNMGLNTFVYTYGNNIYANNSSDGSALLPQSPK